MSEVAAAWPLPVRLAHWLNAALVIVALTIGALMVLAVHNAATRFDLTQTHKSVGVSVLVLTLLRLGMRYLFRAPKLDPTARSLAIVGRAVHVGLYVLLLLLPLSGWLMATSTPLRVPTTLFGLFELPYPFAPDIWRFHLAHTAHIALAIALSTLIVLHVAAAFVHAWVWRDRAFIRMRL
jgi:cytochrome b561